MASARCRAATFAVQPVHSVRSIIVLHAKGAAPSLLPALLRRAGIEVIAFTDHHATLAADAYATYGRGRHPAALNFGDCMTYAVAQSARVPLLFVGDGFARTDLEPALT